MLGSCIASYLKNDYSVIGISRSGGESIDYECDFLNLSKLNEILNIEKADIIINCAAITDLNYCQNNIDEAFKIHYFLSLFLSKRKERNFYISTDSVFDGVKGDYREDDKTKPLNVYSMSKFMGEIPILQAGGLVLRVNIYGFNINANNKKNTLFEWAFKNIASKNSITGYRDVIFNPVSVFGLSKIIKILIETNLDGLLNIGSSRPISKAEFIRSIADIVDKHYDGLTFGLQPVEELKRPKNTSLDLTKFKKIGLEQVDLNDDLYSTVLLYKNTL